MVTTEKDGHMEYLNLANMWIINGHCPPSQQVPHQGSDTYINDKQESWMAREDRWTVLTEILLFYNMQTKLQQQIIEISSY